jgi:hypothetical protein
MKLQTLAYLKQLSGGNFPQLLVFSMSGETLSGGFTFL